MNDIRLAAGWMTLLGITLCGPFADADADADAGAGGGQPLELRIQMTQTMPQIWVKGATGPVWIECTTDLGLGTAWSPLTLLPASNNPSFFIDATTAHAPRRYYRATSTAAIPASPDPQLFAWIRPGTFAMGTPGSQVVDGPQTTVTLSRGFWMSRVETTQEDYLTVTGRNPSAFSGDLKRPVEQVTWNDATDYCTLLTVRDWLLGRLPAGYVYRLPTEAEWEYACRAGTTTATAFGDGLSSVQANFWGDYPYGGAAKGPFLQTTAPVGSYTPNAWGLHDMHGNVWEWCSDWYGDYPGGSVTDPSGPITGLWRVYRGGAWYDWGESCRSASRDCAGPGTWTTSLGFRPVLAQGRLEGLATPVILREPQTQTVKAGGTVTFGLLASGSYLFYQWRLNGVDILAATNGNYRISNVQRAHAGNYSVVIRNMEGSVDSQTAALTVDVPVDPESERLVWINPGTFTRGSPNTEAERKADETPQTQVTLSAGFWISKYETTQEEYESVMGVNPGSFKGIANRPVESVTWEDATRYCAELTLRERSSGRLPAGYAYRLPTEAEWEYACRAGTTTPVAMGTSLGSTQANFSGDQPYAGAAQGPSLGSTTRVGSYAPNAWSLYDMHGNVSEWCLDWYDTYPGGTAADPQGPTTGSYRVLRGGSWSNSGAFCRSASRSSRAPNTAAGTSGFRPVLAQSLSDDWGFENPTLPGWQSTGDFSDWRPVVGDHLTVKHIPGLWQQMAMSIGGDYWRNLAYPVGHKGRQWLSTAVYVQAGTRSLPTDTLDESWTGTLISKCFILQKPIVTFLIGGGQDDARLRVELLVQVSNPGPDTLAIDNADYEIADHATGHGKESMRRAYWDVNAPGLTGKAARIRIVDDSASGHLNVDDFRFQDSTPANERITLGGQPYPAIMTFEGEELDSDSPVWGFADLHTHPMSYLGFGGKIMHGQPDGGAAAPGDMSVALGNCKANHGGWGLDNPQGDYWRQILMSALDNAGTDPHQEGWSSEPRVQFRNWPVFSTIAHQQMWYEWIQRARDGGLRVMVALCVNNRLLARVSKGDRPRNDQAVGDSQIAELKAFAGRHGDFMEIAYDPFQLRDIVRRGKLAVVIGSELDDIGDLAQDPKVKTDADDVSKQLVSAELKRLHAAGVRYIFPVHLVDNKFAGTAIADSMMLNMANKYINGVGFQVQRATEGDNLQFWLENLNLLGSKKDELAGLMACLAPGSPCLPALLSLAVPILTAAQSILAPAAAGAPMSGGLMPLAVFGAASLPVLLTIIGIDQGDVVQAIIPLPDNYPTYPTKAEAPYGVRNARGLTQLGQYAVGEMMSLGMMIDVDHMSQEAIEGTQGVLSLASGRSMPYPVNCGHNGFRELSLHDRNENSRSTNQMNRLRALGGMMGVGWENSKDGSFTKGIGAEAPSRQFSHSVVTNDCAGTSRTFAQTYLLALERLEGSHVAIGTDIDGFVISPGPRFGPQAAFGLGTEDVALRGTQIKDQDNGVLYEPRHGPALTTGAFRGAAMHPKNLTGSVDSTQGYVYTVDQADFFAALSIFHSLKTDVEAGRVSLQTLMQPITTIVNSLSGNYGGQYPDFDTSGGSGAHIANYAAGLLAGIYDWPIGDDFQPDKTATTKLGKFVYLSKVRGSQPPPQIAGLGRYVDLLRIWDDYQKIFGSNIPLKRCQTGFKQWDINFEGVAHYGLLPDFLQDLANVGLDSRDLSVLFRSAEDFARMWTQSLNASKPELPNP